VEITHIEPFLDYRRSVRGRTRRVIECIPREQLEWSQREGAWSFGDLLRHLAGLERYMFAENVRGLPSRYPGHGRELADGWDAVIGYWNRLEAESLEIFAATGTDSRRSPSRSLRHSPMNSSRRPAPRPPARRCPAGSGSAR
jgi:hypothetical protein